MAFKATEWEYSKEVDVSAIPPEAGDRDLYITDARYLPDVMEYHIMVRDLTNNAEFTLRYWLNTRGKDDSIVPNSASRGTLISLGQALAGTPIGIPAPNDIIGGVVIGTVVLKESSKGGTFPRIYKFRAETKDVVDACSDIDQYSEDVPKEN